MVGLSYKPLFGNRSINHPVILTKNVLDNAGTGIIHMAPAHGHEDYQAFLTHGLLQNNPLISIIDSNGRYTRAVEDIWGNASGSRLVGLDVFGRGNKEVLSLLEGDGGSLLGVEKYRHRYPYDWRTGKPLIIRATAQWFANLEGIKEKAMKALESVEFYPPICEHDSLKLLASVLLNDPVQRETDSRHLLGTVGNGASQDSAVGECRYPLCMSLEQTKRSSPKKHCSISYPSSSERAPPIGGPAQ